MRIWRKRATVRRKNHSNLNKRFWDESGLKIDPATVALLLLLRLTLLNSKKKSSTFKIENFQGPTLWWWEDCASWLDKTTWQVITYQVIGRGTRGQGDKLTCQVNLSSWLVCQVELVTASRICQLWKKFAGVSRQFFWESLSRWRRCLRDFSVHFLRVVVVCLKFVFSDGLDVKYDWHNPLSTSFSLYKQSRSDTGSRQKIGINKERESERFSHQRCRTF